MTEYGTGDGDGLFVLSNDDHAIAGLALGKGYEYLAFFSLSQQEYRLPTPLCTGALRSVFWASCGSKGGLEISSAHLVILYVFADVLAACPKPLVVGKPAAYLPGSSLLLAAVPRESRFVAQYGSANSSTLHPQASEPAWDDNRGV